MATEHLIPLLIIPVALVLAVLRNRRKRELKPHLLWVVPTIVTALILFGIWGMSMNPNVPHVAFGPLDWGLLALGFAIGCYGGWWRGKTITIEKEPDGRLLAQASPLGIIILLGVFLGRRGLEALLEGHAAEWRLNVLALTDAFMLLAVGLIIFQRVEMFIRARRIRAGQLDSHVEVAA